MHQKTIKNVHFGWRLRVVEYIRCRGYFYFRDMRHINELCFQHCDHFIWCINLTHLLTLVRYVRKTYFGNWKYLTFHFFSLQGVEIEKVVNSGPGLVFITYPEVVLKLPGGPIWAVAFFLMLVVCNIKSFYAIINNI